MTLMYRAVLAATLLLSPVMALAQNHPVKVVASQMLRLTTAKGSGDLPLYISRDWSKPLPGITRALVVVHGMLRNGDSALEVGKRAAVAAKAEESTIVIAPQFLQAMDADALHFSPEILRWARQGWSGGGEAMSPAPINSFEAIDAILARLANRTLFPNLAEVVIVGHSAGGQTVQRYILAGRGEAVLTQAGIHVRYVVANPSSYVYFNEDRPLPGGGFGPFNSKSCRDFNKWKFGLKNLPPYIGNTSAVDLENAYIKRDVIYLFGDKDIDPNHPELDKTCMAEAEGAYRMQRGLNFFHYLQLRHPQDLTQRAWIVPGIGHDSNGMFNSTCGLAAIFDKGVCTTPVK